MKTLLLFAASRDQLNYFFQLNGHVNIPIKVVWYKRIWRPAWMTGLPWASLRQQVEILHKRKAIRLKRKPNLLRYYFDLLKATWLYLQYIRLLRSTKVDVVGIWNGKKFRQAILVVAAQTLDKELLYFETGPLPGYSAVDPTGVDFYSSLPRQADFYRQLDCGHFKVKHVPQLSELSLLESPYIFVPFQVVEDSNIYLHSPWVKDMRHLFDLIERLAKSFPNQRFLLKTHPACPERYDDLLVRAKNSNGRVQFVSGLETLQLVAQAEAVMTVNSTVGMEALMAHKKLLVLGEAIYGVPELVKLVHSEDELEQVFSGLRSWQLDENLIERFLCYLQRDYAVIGDAMNHPNEAHWRAMESKLQRMLSEDPLKVIGLK